jgi:hypothetical protein
MVAYTTGMVIAPMRAQNPLIPTYGTCASVHSTYFTSWTTHIVISIAISNRIESEIPLESNYPGSQGIHHLCQRRVNIKVVFPSNVLSCKSAKVDFVENDLIRFRDSVEADYECYDCESKSGSPRR